MPVTSRPTAPLTNFAVANPAGQALPSPEVIATGWQASQKPPASWFNYLLAELYTWIGWLDYNVGNGLGGGGASVNWMESAALTPIPVFENNIQVYSYDPGNTGQALVAALGVPKGYNSGSKITLTSRVYSASTSGTLLFRTLTTLVRTGLDPVTSTTNQRSSTNAALTLSSPTVNVPQIITCDLTDESGKVNGVSVSSGDLLIVQLLRGQDTSTASARCITLASAPSFGGS